MERTSGDAPISDASIVTTALHGVRILELATGIAGAVTTMLLADFGADVVRVSLPASDERRSDPGFAAWDRNKRTVYLDPASTIGRAHLARLVSGADICVTGNSDDEVLDPKALRSLLAKADNRGLVLLETPPYLANAPWAGKAESVELLGASLGISMRQYSSAEGPVDPVAPHLLYEQGVWAAACAVAAIIERLSSGQGQVVTVGGAHAALIAGYATFLVDPSQPDIAVPGPGGPNPAYSRYECSDGQWLFLGALTPNFQRAAFRALGLLDLLDEPATEQALDARGLPGSLDRVRERVAARFRARPRREWLALLEEAGCPAGPVLDRDAWLDHPQLAAIGMRVEVEDPRRGHVVMPGIPLVLTGSPGSVRSAAPAPEDACVIDWDRRAEQRQDTPDAPTSCGPLAGLRVLDVGAILAGPFAGNLLTELGADVVKVEPLTGDPFRVTGFMYNRGMRSIALNLRSPEGHATFCDLVRTADVVIDNFRPGVLHRLKIGYEDLRSINPRIISLSITGFGEGGPLSAKPAFDPILQGMSGMMSAQGGQGEPVFLTLAVNDVTAGAFAALGVCLAVYHRDAHSGAGQRVWTSLAGISAFMQLGELTRFPGRPPPRTGGTDYRGPSALDRLYATEDGWVRLQTDRGALKQLREAGLLSAHTSAEDISSDDLAKSFARRARDEVVEQLTESGVPIVSARQISELVNDMECMEAGLMERHVRPSGAPYFLPGRLARFARTERKNYLVAPGLGEHARSVLREIGYDDAEIDCLVSREAVAEGTEMHLEEFVSYR